MPRTIPASRGWMILEWSLGISFPRATATTSILPTVVHPMATVNNETMTHITAWPIGDGGECWISRAAGRNSASRRRGERRRSLTPRGTRPSVHPGGRGGGRRIHPPDQLVMTALLEDGALLDDHDSVCAPHRAQAVRDQENGAPCTHLAQVPLNDALGFVVEGARGLIEDQNAGIDDERPRNGNPLPLATRQRAAVLADHGVVAFGKSRDEVVRSRKPRGASDGIQGLARIGQGDIVPHRAIEEKILLEHDPHLTTEPGGIDLGHVHAVDEDTAALRHIQSLNELGDGALAGA